MFDIRQLRAMLSPSDSPEQNVIDQLGDRIAEKEAEIFQLRRLGDTIRRNARLFSVLLEKSHEGIVLIAPDLMVLRLIHSSVGYKEQEVSGQSLLSFVHHDDVDSLRSSFDLLLASRAKSMPCEFRLRCEDGSWAWLAGEITDMLDDPEIQAILLNVRNVTEQSQHRAAAEKLESYRACPDYAMFSKTPDGVVLDWNPGAQKAFGYSADAIVGNSIEILVPVEMLAEERSVRERISRGEEVPVFPTTRIRKDGGRVKINLSLAAVRDGRGNVKAITHLSHVMG